MNNNLEKDKIEDKVEIVKQTQAESQRVLVGRLKPERNHTLFEFNIDKKEVRKAEFKKEIEINFEDAQKGDISTSKQVDIKDGCFYVSALNEKNAWKKLKQRFENLQ